MEYPSFARRVLAFLCDIIIISVFFYTVNTLIEKDEAMSNVVSVLFLLTMFCYEPILLSTSNTVGKKLFGIVVRSNKDFSKKMGVVRNFIRFFFKIISITWVIPCFIYVYNQRVGYDSILSSVVLYKEYGEKKILKHLKPKEQK